MEINRRNGGREPLSQINITPFVDVMLVLLIIFMVTASLGQQGVDVNLPRVKAKTMKVSEDMIVVTIDSKLHIYVNTDEVGINDLPDKLKTIYAGRKNKSIFLRADKAVVYGDFVKVVAVIKASGVEQLGMITEVPKKGEGS
jgi:biopolymer transport protein TolR